MDRVRVREMINWNSHYQEEWDSTPYRYAESGVVSCGKSRRLGLLETGRIKAYVGVQHFDPNKGGWAVVNAAQARFFASLFIDGRVVTLRNFETVDLALDWLSEATRWRQ